MWLLIVKKENMYPCNYIAEPGMDIPVLTWHIVAN